MTHEDFMVGSADLSIIGTTHEGEEVEIFRDGNFTF
jgi:aminopeptidase